MIFNSFLFILIFLPVAVSGWYLLNRRSAVLAEWFLIGMGLWFYGSFSLWYLVVLGVSIVFNYGVGGVLQRAAGSAGNLRRNAKDPSENAGDLRKNAKDPSKNAGDLQKNTKAEENFRDGVRSDRFLLAAGIIVNLLFLGWFKYVTPELSALINEGQISTAPAISGFIAIGLPVGFSFYTFSQISYLIDSRRGEIAADGFRRYVLYITYFPKIIEGPITCYEEVMGQLRDPGRRHFEGEGFTRGLCLFVFGLAKKLLIADVLSGPAAFGLQSAYYLDTLSVLVTMSCYALQLYMDFSGYCDMAMGISRMLNIELPLNFDAPFQAESFPEFWKRWHMTLTRFFTRYVYIPLGGSRKGQVRTCLNVMIIFLLSAFWHGLGGTYLVWGLLSGAFVVIGNLWKRFARERAARMENENAIPAPRASKSCHMLKRTGVYLLFLFTLIFFGAANLEYSGAILRRFLVPLYPGWLYRLAAKLDLPEFWLLNKLVAAVLPGASNPVMLAELLLMLVIALVLVNARRTAVRLAETMELNTTNAVLVGILLVVCLCSVSGVSTYLYFQF